MIEVYTDGAYSSSRDQGGWAFLVLYQDKILIEKYDGVKSTTNNRMEIMGVLEAVKYLQGTEHQCTIYTDSMYVVGTLTLDWKRRVNNDLWDEFEKLDMSQITVKHVKGHSSNIYNNKCDELAVFGSQLNIN